MKKPTLTVCDWEEIWSALQTKAGQLENGDFGESDEDCNVHEWAKHLLEIMNKIGDDGHIAAGSFRARECQHKGHKGEPLS